MKVVTGKVRGSYVNIFNPRMNDFSGKEEYSICILIPKDDRDTVAKIQAAVKAVVAKKWSGKTPANLRTPLRDGDEERPGDPAYAGHYFMNLKSRDKPGVVDRNRDEVLHPAEFVSGDYCRVSMGAYAYDMHGNRGVSFGLGNVQVLEKGEPLSSRSRAADEFTSWGDDDDDDMPF